MHAWLFMYSYCYNVYCMFYQYMYIHTCTPITRYGMLQTTTSDSFDLKHSKWSQYDFNLFIPHRSRCT